MGEELPCRHSAQKHVFRLTVWSRFLQVWWYAYTTADYLTIYDGNWLDPCYALTTLRYRSAGLPVYFHRLRRLQQALLESQVTASRVCVLAPTASMRNNYPYTTTQTEVRDLFWLLFPRNDLFELVPEEYLLDGRACLDDFDVLILPVAPYLADPLQRQIIEWLESGRRLLVALGPCGVYDELGLPSGRLLEGVFGRAKPEFRPPTLDEPRWTLDQSPDTGKIEGRLGDSEVVVLLPSLCQLPSGPNGVDGLIGQIEAAAPRAVYDDKNALEMMVRARGDTRYLCVLNPSVDDPAESTVHVEGAFPTVTDLDYPDGFPVPATIDDEVTTFGLKLAPGEGTILRLSP